MNIKEEAKAIATDVFYCDEQEGERPIWEPFEDWETEDIEDQIDTLSSAIERIVEKAVKAERERVETVRVRESHKMNTKEVMVRRLFVNLVRKGTDITEARHKINLAHNIMIGEIEANQLSKEANTIVSTEGF
jgi:hypothetical protein